MTLQMAMFTPKTEWVPPLELPDLTNAKEIAIDVETRDPNIKTLGPGWARKDGEVVGYAVATSEHQVYVPVKHFGGGNLDNGREEQLGDANLYNIAKSFAESVVKGEVKVKYEEESTESKDVPF